jgi:hypothetical protein
MIKRHQNVSNILQLALTKYEDGNVLVNLSIFCFFVPVHMTTYSIFHFLAKKKIQLQILRANVYDYNLQSGPYEERAAISNVKTTEKINLVKQSLYSDD